MISIVNDVVCLLAYMELKPEEPGVRCLRIEESLSPAILDIGIGDNRRLSGEEGCGSLEDFE